MKVHNIMLFMCLFTSRSKPVFLFCSSFFLSRLSLTIVYFVHTFLFTNSIQRTYFYYSSELSLYNYCKLCLIIMICYIGLLPCLFHQTTYVVQVSLLKSMTDFKSIRNYCHRSRLYNCAAFMSSNRPRLLSSPWWSTCYFVLLVPLEKTIISTISA